MRNARSILGITFGLMLGALVAFAGAEDGDHSITEQPPIVVADGGGDRSITEQPPIVLAEDGDRSQDHERFDAMFV